MESEIAVRCARRRLVALGFVAADDFFRDGSRMVLRLTENGHRVAAARTGGALHTLSYRDDVHPDMMQHLLRSADVFIETVAGGDWMSARERADAFVWHSSNDNTKFIWRQPAVQGRHVIRNVTPDVTIEVPEKRIFVEIERSTKTLETVFNKVQQYHDLFSPAVVSAAETAYQQKYPDRKPVEVWWVFDSAIRAKHVDDQLKRQSGQQGFYTPAYFVGTLEQVSERLRATSRIHVVRAASPKDDGALRTQAADFVREILTSRDVSSLKWPSNWRALGKLVFSPDEWAKFEPAFLQRVSDALSKAGVGAHGASPSAQRRP